MSNDEKNQLEIEDGVQVKKKSGWITRSLLPFRTATLRGLAIILPPLLTIIFFIWAWNVIDTYLVRPIESAVVNTIAYSMEETYDDQQVAAKIESGEFQRQADAVVNGDGVAFVALRNGQWIPSYVHETATNNAPETALVSAKDYFRHHVQKRHLKRHLFIPAFMALFLAILYLLGKILAAGIGRIFLRLFESVITQLPIIRNVYSSVKQVTDFALNENEMTFTRIVAVEYPRKGIWSMGFVTGEGMTDIRDAAGEPILTVLMPTSPMPATGFTISVAKSETIDLNISIDQAVQFCISCGVVIPDHQQPGSMVEGEVKKRLQQAAGTSNDSAPKNIGSVANSG